MIPLTEAPKVAEQTTEQATKQAKNGAETSARRQRLGRLSAAIVAALALTALAGIATYLWPQVTPSAPLALAGPVLAAPLPHAAATKPAQPSRVVSADATSARNAEPAAEPTLPAGAIRVATARPAIDPVLVRGYEAYMASDLAAARDAYETLLAQDARNIAALHGMAAISLRQAQSTAAEEYYQRALEVDPKDALAQSGLIGLKGHGDPLQSESRLKSLLAAQPGLFSLHFALGNLYAGQGRWSEAQQAYFRAVSSDPDNPDGLFNLAVGLDQLHQPKLAANYYQRALAAAADRPVGFDRAQATARLVELQ